VREYEYKIKRLLNIIIRFHHTHLNGQMKKKIKRTRRQSFSFRCLSLRRIIGTVFVMLLAVRSFSIIGSRREKGGEKEREKEIECLQKKRYIPHWKTRI